MGMKVQDQPLNISYAFGPEAVVVTFSQLVKQLGLRPHELDAMVVALQDAKQKREAWLAAGQPRLQP